MECKEHTCQLLSATSLHLSTFFHIKRDLNGVANNCAKQVLRLSLDRPIYTCSSSAHSQQNCPLLSSLQLSNCQDIVIHAAWCSWAEMKIGGSGASVCSKKKKKNQMISGAGDSFLKLLFKREETVWKREDRKESGRELESKGGRKRYIKEKKKEMERKKSNKMVQTLGTKDQNRRGEIKWKENIAGK